MAARVRDTDRGLKNYTRAVTELSKLRADVGFWGSGKEPNGELTTDVAAYMEYGTENVPSRPFMRHAADTGADKIFANAVVVARQVIKGSLSGRALLESVAIDFKEVMKETVRNAKSWATPLAARTIARKGHDRPLVDSSTMVNAIDHRIRNK